jgi:hypothetical protein
MRTRAGLVKIIGRGPFPICRRWRIPAWDLSHARETKRADPEIGPRVAAKPMQASRLERYLPDFVWLDEVAPVEPAPVLVAPVEPACPCW